MVIGLFARRWDTAHNNALIIKGNKMKKPSWTELTETATKAGNWSNSDVAKFHYFNMAGLNAVKRETDKQISNLVTQGKCLSGALLTYGTFNDYASNILRYLAMERKSVRYAEISIVLAMLHSDIEKAKAFIAEKS